jgi:hypothetical protein
MASTYSTDLKIELMATGENAGTWGTKTNTNWNVVQQAIAGYEAISIAGGAQTTALVMTNATISTARNAVVKLTGTITGNQIVTIPDGIEKTYIIENGTTGAFTVQFKTVSGTGPTFSTTDKGIKIVYSNGSNIIDVNANLSGPTLASDLDVNGKSIISTSNGNITLAPNGTGDVYLDADTVRVGDSGAAATLTTNGAGNLTINTNSGTNSGTIVINQGTNGNIAITPNGTGNVVLDGLNWPQADGSNGQVLQTNGSGQLAFGTISSSPTQLVSSIPLASGVSVTAGKLVNINSSGEIPAYPTLNTYGSAQTNSSTTAYSYLSTDGSRALKLAITTGGSTSYLFTFNGVAISNTGTPTNGTVSVTQSLGSAPTGYFNYIVYPISSTQFIVNTVRYLVFGNCCNYQRNEANSFIVTVDASGNCTKGTVNSTGSSGNTSNTGSIISYGFGKITNDIFAFNLSSTASTTNAIFTISGSTITATSDSDAQYWVSCNGSNAQLTTNNILGFGTGASWRTATYTASPVGIGTYTDTTAISDYLSSATWYMMKLATTANADYALATYIDTNGVTKYKTFSINQTTGALTLVETGNFSALVGFSGNITFKDKDNFVAGGTATSYSFTNGVLNGYNSQGYTPVGTALYNSGNLYYIFYTSASNFPVNIGYTVNAYATSVVNYLGVVKTTTSTSPASIVTDGVATGFTSLTRGSLYYSTAPFDGTVVASSASGILIGKAISTTEILMQRSNTQ